MITAERYHDFSMGHRVAGHESKCADLHGHNYRAYFVVTSVRDDGLDSVGRVIDFSVIKTIACEWLESQWDHKFLLWEDDPQVFAMVALPGVKIVPFNPTAENMATYLLQTLGPHFLTLGVKLISVRLDETRKCSATAYAGKGLENPAR